MGGPTTYEWPDALEPRAQAGVDAERAPQQAAVLGCQRFIVVLVSGIALRHSQGASEHLRSIGGVDPSAWEVRTRRLTPVGSSASVRPAGANGLGRSVLRDVTTSAGGLSNLGRLGRRRSLTCQSTLLFPKILTFLVL